MSLVLLLLLLELLVPLTPLAFSNQDTEFVKFLASIGSSMKEFADFDPAEGSESFFYSKAHLEICSATTKP